MPDPTRPATCPCGIPEYRCHRCTDDAPRLVPLAPGCFDALRPFPAAPTDCDTCGELHDRAGWDRYLANYDGPDGVDTAGPGAMERHTQAMAVARRVK